MTYLTPGSLFVASQIPFLSRDEVVIAENRVF
jgi:hypothetical protein